MKREAARIEVGKALAVMPHPSDVVRLCCMVMVVQRGYEDADGVKTPCWEWRGSKDKDGYPKFKVQGNNLFAHRYAYAIFHLDFDLDGCDVHHRCENRKCVNPEHLEKQDSYHHRKIAEVPF